MFKIIGALALFVMLAGCATAQNGNGGPISRSEFRSPAQLAAFRTVGPATTTVEDSTPGTPSVARLSVTESPGTLRRIASAPRFQVGNTLVYSVLNRFGIREVAYRVERVTDNNGYVLVSSDGYTRREFNGSGNQISNQSNFALRRVFTPSRHLLQYPIDVSQPFPALSSFTYPHSASQNYLMTKESTVEEMVPIRLCVGLVCHETIRIRIKLSIPAWAAHEFEMVWVTEDFGIVQHRLESSFFPMQEYTSTLVACVVGRTTCPGREGS